MTSPAPVAQPFVGIAPTSSSRRFADSPWIPALSAAAIAGLALWNSTHKSLWVDEAYTLLTAQRSLAGTWQHAVHFELQPPLYFILIHLWLQLGPPTVEWIRTFSTVCAVACVPLLWGTRRTATRRAGLPAPVLAAVLPTVVWAAAEARAYALTLFFCSWTFYFFIRLLEVQTRRSRIDAALYALGAYAALLTFYYSGFLLAGQWIAAVAVSRGRRWLTAALAAVAVAMIPWLPLVHMQMMLHANPNLPLGEQSLVGIVPDGGPGALLTMVTGSIFGNAPVLTHWTYASLSVALLVLAVPLARVLAPDQTAVRPATAAQVEGPGAAAGSPIWDEWALLVAFVVPVVCLLALRAFNLVVVFPRHMVCVTPGFILLWSLWTARTAPGVWRWSAAATLLAACAFTLVSYERHVDVADSRRAADYVAAHGAPHEPVLIVGPEAAFPFQYYYGHAGGTAPLVGVPIDASLTTYDPALFALGDTAQIGVRLRVANVRDGFWLVVWQGFLYRTPGAREVIDQFLHDHTVASPPLMFTNMYVVHATVR